MGKRHQLQCRRPDVDPDIFFSNSVRKIERAKQLCSMCPAQHKCLLASFARPGELGTWGGMTQNERAAVVDTAHTADNLELSTGSADLDKNSNASTDAHTCVVPDSPPRSGTRPDAPPQSVADHTDPGRDHAQRTLAGTAA